MAKCRAGMVQLLFLYSYCMTNCSSQEISVAPSNAGSLNLYTINDFCQDTSAISNTVVTILNGTHRLNTTCDIKNANNVTLKAEQGTKVVITCENCGFKFLNVSQLKISDIEFRGCGATWQKFGSAKALVFVNGSNLHLVNVKTLFREIYIENVAGNVTLDFCEISSTSAGAGSSILVYYDTDDHVIFKLTNSLIIDNAKDINFYLLASKLNLLFDNVTFSNNTFAYLSIAFGDLASLTISNTTFRNCSSTLSVSLKFDLFHNTGKRSPVSHKLLNIVNSNFLYSYAQEGCIVIEWDGKSQLDGSILIKIVNTTFNYNSEGAVVLKGSIYGSGYLPPYKFMPKISISKCVFLNHYGRSDSSAVIAASNAPYLRLHEITIEYNNCTGIEAMQSILVFSSSTKIANNSAVVGAGMKLTDTEMVLAPNTELIITGNSAQKTGGGIQVIDESMCKSVETFDCFFSYLEPNNTDPSTVNFTVANNRALEGGDNIFGLTSCGNLLVEPQNSKSSNSSVSSYPAYIYCNGKECPYQFDVYAYPGERFTFEDMVLRSAWTSYGNFYPLVSGSVLATASGVAIKELEKIQKVSLSGSNITYTLYSTKHKEGSISVKPTDLSCNMLPIEIKIHFLNCPLGFNLSEIDEGKFACQCAPHLQAVSNCSIQTQTITKRKDSWLGKYVLNNHSYLATSDYCPYDYCKSSFQSIKSDNLTLHQDDQCQSNRTGILCGACPEGWSLVLGSSECREECSNVWLLLILIFALEGLLLVVAIHFLNLTVTMGTLSGLIFFINIFEMHSVSVLSKYPIPVLTPILHIFLSWLNLYLGISTCFYHGMEAFGQTMFLFVFPVYIWLISATIIALSNRYIFFTRLVGENAVKILSTLFLLSYSKILHATVDCLKLKSVDVFFNNFTSSETRWAVDGNIPYFDPQRHLALFVIALFFIFLLLPFTMSLLCIRHVYSLSNCCRVFSCVDKLKPFFDTYTGPFKDKARFWTGLLLFVRLVLIIVHSMDYSDEVVPYYIIVAVCFILTTIMILLQGVYKRQSLNILEYFFILNLGAIFLINTYKEGPESWKSIFTHLLVSLTLLAFLGILAYHIYLKFSPFVKKRLQLRPQNADRDVDSFEWMREYQPVHQDP